MYTTAISNHDKCLRYDVTMGTNLFIFTDLPSLMERLKRINAKNMRTVLLACILASSGLSAQAQRIQDLKVKNASNQSDRTLMLDILRATMYQEYKQELVFVVNHFRMGGNYAWFMGDVQRKDGKRFVLKDEGLDCCHVEALFKKSGSKWYIVENVAFSTDVWWEGIHRRYPAAPAAIFDDFGRMR